MKHLVSCLLMLSLVSFCSGQNKSNYTGTPISRDTKLIPEDIVQVFFRGKWMDAKVQKVFLNGRVQVRLLAKPRPFFPTTRNLLQFAPGGQPKAVASDEKNGSSRTSKAGGGKSEPAKVAGHPRIDSASVDELLKIIGTKTDHLRVLAAEKLRDNPEAGSDPIVAKKLVELLKVDDLNVRAAVAHALEKWACPEINDDVLKNVNASTTEVRQSMMKILSAHQFDAASGEIAKRLPDSEDRKVATESLIAMGEPAQAAVIPLLDHRDSKVKLAVCEILKEIGSADGLAALKKASETWMGSDRFAARKTIQALEAKK